MSTTRVPFLWFHTVLTACRAVQVNKLRDSIQNITRTTGPLSSCVDFVQEVRRSRRACSVRAPSPRAHTSSGLGDHESGDGAVGAGCAGAAAAVRRRAPKDGGGVGAAADKAAGLWWRDVTRWLRAACCAVPPTLVFRLQGRSRMSTDCKLRRRALHVRATRRL